MCEHNKIYFLCGNARTFSQCFDSAYSHIIDKLFDNNTKTNTHVLFYLKCDDPGPKGQKGWNFTYSPINKEELENQILHFTKKYKNITFHSKVLLTNEIGDDELFGQVKHRNLYNRFLSDDKKLLRALHYNYNIERCGKIIEEIELKEQIQFDYYIFMRPDLFFLHSCKHISNYTSDNKIILENIKASSMDHFAIIPKKQNYTFFFSRMDIFRTNDKEYYWRNEDIMRKIIKDSVETNISQYKIKRR
jgi:hypothetical protein